ncbi:hypothetical protein TNCV_3921471 [Trichonephila clavipes]|nr:hypothetical protein TNCV_3921471 [Trichonephila clavipes]
MRSFAHRPSRNFYAVGSLVVRASDSRPEGLGSMPDTTKHPPSTHGFTCRNCGGGDRGRVAIYRPFGEFRRAKIALSPVWCSRPTTGVPLAHATMNFVGIDLTTSDSQDPSGLLMVESVSVFASTDAVLHFQGGCPTSELSTVLKKSNGLMKDLAVTVDKILDPHAQSIGQGMLYQDSSARLVYNGIVLNLVGTTLPPVCAGKRCLTCLAVAVAEM